MYNMPIYIAYICYIVGGTISISAQYICANESHAIFHRYIFFKLA